MASNAVQACDHFYPLGGDIVSVSVSVFGRWMAIGTNSGSDGAGDNVHLVWRHAPTGKLLYDRAVLRATGARNKCLHTLHVCVHCALWLSGRKRAGDHVIE